MLLVLVVVSKEHIDSLGVCAMSHCIHTHSLTHSLLGYMTPKQQHSAHKQERVKEESDKQHLREGVKPHIKKAKVYYVIPPVRRKKAALPTSAATEQARRWPLGILKF